MHMVEGDLGVTCGFCHIVGKWEKVRICKPEGDCRKMMITTIALNKNNFEGKQMVSRDRAIARPDPVATLGLPRPALSFREYDEDLAPW